MYTTLYVFISFLYYWLDAYPSYRHYKEQPGYERKCAESILPSKWIDFIHRTGFYLATINFVICIIVLFLKFIGAIEWW